MILGSILIIVGAPFAYLSLISSNGNVNSCALAQGYFVISIALFGGCMPTVLVDIFQEDLRYTCVGLSYNAANAIVAGSTTLIQTSLVLTSTWEEWGTADDFTKSILSDSCSFMQGCWWKHYSKLIIENLKYVYLREQNDSRLYPALYLQVISIVAILALTIGTRVIQNRKVNSRVLALQNNNKRMIVKTQTHQINNIESTAVYVQL